MDNWPATLSLNPERRSYRRRRIDDVLRSSPEAGPVVAREMNAPRMEWWFRYTGMTSTDQSTLETFEESNAADIFVWTDPLDSSTHYCMFAEPIEYEISEDAGPLWTFTCHIFEPGYP
jgi:hypothetical protein